LNYINDTERAAHDFGVHKISEGFVTFNVDNPDWANQSFQFLLHHIPNTGNAHDFKPGPIVTINNTPPPPAATPIPTPPVSTQGIAIGIPLAVGSLIALIVFLHFCMKERRKIGPISIGGRKGRSRGYSGRKTRTARMKAQPVGVAGGYTDEEGPRDTRDTEWELTTVKGASPREGGYSDRPSGQGDPFKDTWHQPRP